MVRHLAACFIVLEAILVPLTATPAYAEDVLWFGGADYPPSYCDFYGSEYWCWNAYVGWARANPAVRYDTALWGG